MNNKNKNFYKKNDEMFNENQTKQFLKLIKNNKYECYFKLTMAYQLSRFELLNIEWQDINFNNNTITIYPISYERNGKFYYSWNMKKLEEYKRTFPLLPNIKMLLIKLKNQQDNRKFKTENYNYLNENFICLKPNGTRLNINTLSRNLRYVASDNGLPEILLSGLKNSLDNVICRIANDNDYYRAWTRADYKSNKPRNVYGNYILKNKKFVKELNCLLEQDEQYKTRKSDMEM